ncbi:MAG: hypothetical protein D6724_03225, partial [Armatimonadetes bacterium]
NGQLELKVETSPYPVWQVWTPAQTVTSASPLRRGLIRFKVPNTATYTLGLRVVGTTSGSFRLDNVKLYPAYYPLISIHPTVAGTLSTMTIKGGRTSAVAAYVSPKLWIPTKIWPFEGYWELDVGSVIPFWIGVTDAQFGRAVARFTFPKDKAVTGVPLYWQAVEILPLQKLYGIGPAVDYGFAYDAPLITPAKQWKRVSPTAAPPATSDGFMFYDSNRAVVTLVRRGGLLTLAPEVWDFDGVKWVKRSSSTATIPGVSFACAYDASRKAIVMFTDRGETWEFNGTSWKKMSPSVAPPPRFNPSFAYDAGRQRCVLFGGETAAGSLNDVWEWNGTSWARGPTGPAGRARASLVYDSQHKRLLLYGGYRFDRVTNKYTYYDDTWQLTASGWRLIASTGPGARAASGQVAYDPVHDATYLFGGFNGFWPFKPTLLNDTWVLSNGTWKRVPTAGTPPSARGSGAFAYDARRSVFVLFGGSTGIGSLSDTWELK